MGIKIAFVVYVVGIIVCLSFAVKYDQIPLINLYYGITVWSAIFAVVWKIFEAKEKNKKDKLNQAIQIVNNFDNSDLRKARDFTRLFKKEHDDQNLKKGELADFIENILDEDNKKLYMQKYNITSDEDIRALKSSLVYLFNYFQSVYAIINADMADKDYVLRYLSNVYISLFNRFEVWLTKNCESSDKYQLEDLKKLKEMANNYINLYKS